MLDFPNEEQAIYGYGTETLGQIENQRNWTSNRLGNLAAKGIVLIEMLPTNIGAAAVVQIATHDPTMTATTFGGSSFLLEGWGSIAMADMLEAGTVGNGRVMSWIQGRVDKSKFRNYKTNLPIEASVAMVVGAPATIYIKGRQYPERTKDENRLYGLLMSLGTSAILTANSLAVSEGISHPNPETISAATVATAVVYSAYKWIRSRYARDSRNDGPIEPQSLKQVEDT